jgi:hypothetical protein
MANKYMSYVGDAEWSTVHADSEAEALEAARKDEPKVTRVELIAADKS